MWAVTGNKELKSTLVTNGYYEFLKVVTGVM